MYESDWELLITLNEEKNITKAAEKLYISQPAVTKRIQSLEGELGLKILKRGNKGIEFTNEGKKILAYSIDMWQRKNKFLADLKKVQHLNKSTIRIGSTNSFTKKLLPKVILAVQELYPDINFEITNGWSEDIYKLISKDKVDIAFIKGNYPWKYYEKFLFEDEFYIVSNAPIELKNLPNLNRIDYVISQKLRATIDEWWYINYNAHPVNQLQVDNSTTCKSMVLEGLGFAILPKSVIEEKDNLFKIPITNKRGFPVANPLKMMISNEFLEDDFSKKLISIIESIDLHTI